MKVAPSPTTLPTRRLVASGHLAVALLPLVNLRPLDPGCGMHPSRQRHDASASLPSHTSNLRLRGLGFSLTLCAHTVPVFSCFSVFCCFTKTGGVHVHPHTASSPTLCFFSWNVEEAGQLHHVRLGADVFILETAHGRPYTCVEVTKFLAFVHSHCLC